MSGWFNLGAGVKGAGQGMMLGGPWGALAGGVIGGFMNGSLLNRDEYGQRDAVKSTSFGQAPNRSTQSAYNAPDQGATALRPMPRMANAGMPRMPRSTSPFQNAAATLGMSANNRTYGGAAASRGQNPLMQRPGGTGMWPGL